MPALTAGLDPMMRPVKQQMTPLAQGLQVPGSVVARIVVEMCGGREWTAVRAKANLDAALGALERVRLSAIAHRDLADLAVYVVERES